MYAILFTRGAAKEFRNLGKGDRARIREAIAKLSAEPRPRGKTVKLRDKSYRIRVGEFRLVYVVEEEGKVLIMSRIRRRSESTYLGM